jgi:hypothetical protein
MATTPLTPMAQIRAFAAAFNMVPRAHRQRRPGGSYAAWAGGLGYGNGAGATAAGAVLGTMAVTITDNYGLPATATLYVVRGRNSHLYLVSGYTPSHGLGLWDFVAA